MLCRYSAIQLSSTTCGEIKPPTWGIPSFFSPSGHLFSLLAIGFEVYEKFTLIMILAQYSYSYLCIRTHSFIERDRERKEESNYRKKEKIEKKRK